LKTINSTVIISLIILSVTLVLPWSSTIAEDVKTTRITDKDSRLEVYVTIFKQKDNHGFGILDVPDAQKAGIILSYWDASRYSIMINGGYFTPDFQPLGLFKINGNFINKRKPKKLSGFVAMDREGGISILTHNNNISSYPSILQTGPYVIDPGSRIGIRSNDGKISRRTLIGKTTGNELVIIVTSPVTLYDIANFTKKRFPDTERLLNLDGGPSTALKTDSIEVVNVLPVRSYIFKKKD
jgi:uncharacterized protein YigE (DUF2233 family)